MKREIDLREKSRMGSDRVRMLFSLICPLENTEPVEEWARVTAECGKSLSFHITLDRDCRRLNRVSVEAEVQALLSDNSAEGDAVIYTDLLGTFRVQDEGGGGR